MQGQQHIHYGVGHRTAAANHVQADSRKLANLAEQEILCGKRHLLRSLKLARGFERQKLGRRQKIAMAHDDNATLERLLLEIEALKKLNLVSVAEYHLHKALLRVSSVVNSPGRPTMLKALQNPVDDTASKNVVARLYKATAVKETQSDIIRRVQAALGLSAGKTHKQSRNSIVAATEGQPEPYNMSCIKQSGDSVIKASENRDDEYAKAGDTEPISLSECKELCGEFGIPTATIAVCSDYRTGVDHDEAQGHASNQAAGAEPLCRHVPRTSSATHAGESLHATRLGSPNHLLSSSEKPRLGTSTFLPALTRGGYWSGSDSEPDDGGDPDLGMRRNRRGQRARRQLWEKKFGGNAKHLQHQSQNAARIHWDPRRGALPIGDRSPKGPVRSRRISEVNTESAAIKSKNISTSTPLQSSQNAKPLHPSWEAAKKAKEQRSSAAFQGSKLVFD